jgi:hypothetical protein
MYTCLRTFDPYREYSVADWEAAASGRRGTDGFPEITLERRLAGVADLDGADGLQKFRLLRPAHDVDQRHVLLETKLDQHLTEVRRRCRVDETAVSFPTHRLDHAERRERIDKG